MRFEQRLVDALREEAESHDVDVARLWAETRGRLEQEPPNRPRRWAAIVAAAAAAGVVGAGVAALTHVGGEDRVSPAAPTAPAEGDVADEFTCPEQVVHDWTRPETVVDKYFVATMEGGLEFQAAGYDVPMYELEVEGDRAYVSFGNTDGSLALRSEFHREDGEWVRFRSEVCTGEDGSVAVPVEGPLTLGRHTGEPLAPAFAHGGEIRGTVLLDDRLYYDHVGVQRQRSLYAGACGRSLCISSVSEGDVSTYRLRPGLVPADLSGYFLPYDDPTWRVQPYGLWVLYDTEAQVQALTLNLEDGRTVTADGSRSSEWPGSLHLVLAPFDEVEVLTVHRSPNPGPRRNGTFDFPPGELPGYRADIHER